MCLPVGDIAAYSDGVAGVSVLGYEDAVAAFLHGVFGGDFYGGVQVVFGRSDERTQGRVDIVEIQDPDHPARVLASDYKKAFAARLTEAAREAGANDPERLGEQLALLLDGASARSRVLDADTFATAAVAAVLVDNAIPAASAPAAASLWN